MEEKPNVVPHCAYRNHSAWRIVCRAARIKQRTYAAAGILEYWIVNLRNNTIEVYEQPDRERGEYRLRRDSQPGETIEVALPDGAKVSIRVDEVLG